MKNKPFRVLEVTWLVLSIMCLFAGFHKTYLFGFKNSYIFFLLAALAFLMYTVRKYMRKNSDKKK